MDSKDEIERRFLTTDFSWRNKIRRKQTTNILQGYPPSLQRPNTAIRVRRTLSFTGDYTYQLGVKKKGTKLVTPEEESPLTQERGIELLGMCDKQILSKTRWVVPLTKVLVVQVDEFISLRGEPIRLVISEVEFATEEDALAFVPEDYCHWLGPEITGEYKWSNHSLCLNGIPER